MDLALGFDSPLPALCKKADYFATSKLLKMGELPTFYVTHKTRGE